MEETHAVIRQTTCDNAGATYKSTHTVFEQGSSLPIFIIAAGCVFGFLQTYQNKKIRN